VYKKIKAEVFTDRAHIIFHRENCRKSHRSNDVLGARVIIIKGLQKGSKGLVKEVNDLQVRVELHDPLRVVTVKKEDVKVVGDASSSSFHSSSSKCSNLDYY